MKIYKLAVFLFVFGAYLFFGYGSSQTDSSSASKTTKKAIATTSQTSSSSGSAASANKEDTLIVIARLAEIPGKFAANDLYNYVYVMKYRVVSVVKGTYKEQDILVGHYNPLIPRAQIKDAMKKYVSGNVEKFEVGAKHKLWLIKPIEKVWKDAVDDEYSDSELEKYFSLRADIVK